MYSQTKTIALSVGLISACSYWSYCMYKYTKMKNDKITKNKLKTNLIISSVVVFICMLSLGYVIFDNVKNSSSSSKTTGIHLVHEM